MVAELLRWLGVAIAVQAVGHRLQVSKAKATPLAQPTKLLDEKLVGVWVTTSSNEVTQFTYLKNHQYVWRWGRPKFKTGFYEEKGRWEIISGGRVELIPASRKNTVSKTDQKLLSMVKNYEKSMDEGAWKPMPKQITFSGKDSFGESLPLRISKEVTRYRRLKK